MLILFGTEEKSLIEVRNLTKKYGHFPAVSNISFNIEQGNIYGFLGPNGAGKSTTMNMITGCLSATSGNVIIDGEDIFENPIQAKRKIGYLPEIPPLYPEMTPAEYLSFVAEAKGVGAEESIRQVKEVMELTQISDMADRLIRNLSKGYRQRVGIAQALLGNPDVIILDEPTVGLDPRQITQIRELIRSLGKFKTVIVSSHILAEISEICNHVMILSHGRLVANDTIQNLEDQASADQHLMLTVKGISDEVFTVLSKINGVRSVDRLKAESDRQCRFSLDIDRENDPRDAIFYALAEHKMPIVDMTWNRATLEDIFLRLTSAEFPDEEENESEESDNYTPQFAATDFPDKRAKDFEKHGEDGANK